jgi:hypothetical protein
MALKTPVLVGTTIAGTYQDGPGHTNQSHLIWAANCQRWFLFTITSASDTAGNPGTHAINCYVSSESNLDTASWTSLGSSPNMDAATAGSSTKFDSGLGGGRSMGCCYVNNSAGSNQDLVYIYASLAFVAGAQNSYNGLIRAVVTAGSITWGTWGGWSAAAWNLVGGSTAIIYGNAVGITGDGYLQLASCVMHTELDCNVCTTVDPAVVDSYTEGGVTATGDTAIGSASITNLTNETGAKVGMAISNDGSDWTPNRFPRIGSIVNGTRIDVETGTTAINAATGLSTRWWQGTTGSTRTTTMIDSTMAHECTNYAFAPLASNGMLLVYGDGGGTNGQPTDFKSMKANQTQAQGFWPSTSDGTGGVAVFGSAVTIDPQDWCVIPVDTTHIYAARRTGTTTIAMRSYTTGTNTWAALTAPPATTGTIKAGGGVVGATDGTDFWLFVIDSTNNQIIYNKYSVSGAVWGAWVALANVPTTATKMAAQVNANAAGGVNRNLAGLIYSVQNSTNWDTYVVALKTAITPPVFTFDFRIGSTRPAPFRPGLAR